MFTPITPLSPQPMLGYPPPGTIGIAFIAALCTDHGNIITCVNNPYNPNTLTITITLITIITLIVLIILRCGNLHAHQERQLDHFRPRDRTQLRSTILITLIIVTNCVPLATTFATPVVNTHKEKHKQCNAAHKYNQARATASNPGKGRQVRVVNGLFELSHLLSTSLCSQMFACMKGK
jgi:uncharacterized membrane protein YidH (DUF202 family)